MTSLRGAGVYPCADSRGNLNRRIDQFENIKLNFTACSPFGTSNFQNIHLRAIAERSRKPKDETSLSLPREMPLLSHRGNRNQSTTPLFSLRQGPPSVILSEAPAESKDLACG